MKLSKNWIYFLGVLWKNVFFLNLIFFRRLFIYKIPCFHLFDKWLHRTTFWHKVSFSTIFLFLFSMNRSWHRFWNANQLLILWTYSWNFVVRGGGNQVVWLHNKGPQCHHWLISEGPICFKLYSKMEIWVMGIDVLTRVQSEGWYHIRKVVGASNYSKGSIETCAL
jgi:hypothetical protein